MKSITASALALASLVPGVRANVFEEGDAPDYPAMCAEKEGEYTEKVTKDNVGFALCEFADGTACLAEKLGAMGACGAGTRKPKFEDHCEAIPEAQFVLKEGEVGATVYNYAVCEVAQSGVVGDLTITEFGYFNEDDGGEDGDHPEAVVIGGETNPAWRLALDETHEALFGGTWMTVPRITAEFPKEEGEESDYSPLPLGINVFVTNVLTVKMPAEVEEGEEFQVYVSFGGMQKIIKGKAPVGGLAEGQFILLPSPFGRNFPNLPSFSPLLSVIDGIDIMGVAHSHPGGMQPHAHGMGFGWYGGYPNYGGFYYGGYPVYGGGDRNGGGGGGSHSAKSEKMSSGSKVTERSASASAKSGTASAKSGKRV